MEKKKQNRKYCDIVTSHLVVIILLLLPLASLAQEPPPRPVSITVTAQQLAFGAFTHGAAGGTVTVSPTGSRFSSGDVILLDLGHAFHPTIYELSGNQGTVVSILNGPDAVLTGSNGGSIILTIGSSNPPSPFVLNLPFPNLISVGGTLTIGNSVANPPGNYSGTYDVIFVQE